MTEDKEKEYIDQIEKLSALVKSAYEIGGMREKAKWIDSVKPYTLLVTMKARGNFDDMEHVQVVLTMDEIRSGRKAILEKLIGHTFLDIATKGDIIRKWIEDGTSRKI